MKAFVCLRRSPASVDELFVHKAVFSVEFKAMIFANPERYCRVRFTRLLVTRLVVVVRIADNREYKNYKKNPGECGEIHNARIFLPSLPGMEVPFALRLGVASKMPPRHFKIKHTLKRNYSKQ